MENESFVSEALLSVAAMFGAEIPEVESTEVAEATQEVREVVDGLTNLKYRPETTPSEHFGCPTRHEMGTAHPGSKYDVSERHVPGTLGSAEEERYFARENAAKLAALKLKLEAEKAA